MQDDPLPEVPARVLRVHGPATPQRALVLDSPHSGRDLPDDFGSIRTADELRNGEDCFIDELWMPAAARGVPLLAAGYARTYLDPNRHAADIDLQMLDGPWPGEHVPSGKAEAGKALLWRTLDDGRPLYDRKLAVAEVQQRVRRYHQPYHQALRTLLDRTHQRFGFVHHINCHSMNAVGGVMSPTQEARADIVLGDRDGTTCAPAFTAFVREVLAGYGYDVKVNDPFKGVELVRAYSNPAAGRHSLQIEVNKRLYLEDQPEPVRHAGFERLQQHLMQLLDAIEATWPSVEIEKH